VRLRVTIPVGVVAITIALAASLVTLNYLTSAAAVHSFTRALLEPIAVTVAEKARSFLDMCSGAAAVAADLAGEAEPAERLPAFEVVAFSLLREHPALFYVQMGDPDGNFQIVERSASGGLDSKQVRRRGGSAISERAIRVPGAPLGQVKERLVEPGEAYDPRVRPWYQGAQSSSGVHWTDVYIHAGGQPVISAARAVRSRNGGFAGAASATVSLEGLSAFLDTIRLRDRAARVFLVDARGALIAASASDRPPPAPAGEVRLPLLSESRAPELAALAQTGAFREALAGAPGGALAYTAGGQRWLAALQPLSIQGGRGWIVGAVIPEDDFLGEVKAGFARAVAVSALVIILFVFLGLALSESIARPLRVIADETRRIRRLELDDRTLPDSVFEEVAEINDVFHSLKTGLRAFQKYVPVKLVRILLAEGTEPVLGGRVEELTVFFSDVRSFASYAEANEPATVAGVLGGYLQTMAETVAAHGGTVDKFIGDAVMAFWNAPRAVDDHPYQAVLAAVRCREAIRGLGHGDALYTRIGLHTARVVVGNFGAPERLAYTALGDGVNLAARLEGVNKEYGTQILITEETFRRLDGRMVCRRIDRIAVKGRTLPTDIHEVLGEPGTVPADIVAAAEVYASALDAYFARSFAEAASLFEEAVSLRPDDDAAAVMRARAEGYLRNPPPPEWTGVFAMTSK
jgi:adenylate cyclase